MAGDPDALFHFIQLSDFISISPLPKSREERGIKNPSISGYSGHSKPTRTSAILFQTQKKRTRQQSRDLNLHPSMCSANTYRVAVEVGWGVGGGGHNEEKIESLLPWEVTVGGTDP